jgi:acyl-CoA synthetase (NDP forming)
MQKNVKEILKRKGPLTEKEVKDILRSYNIPTTKYRLVKDIQDLDDIDLKFPVALKVCSNKILHKTDVGGVKLGIKDPGELRKIFKEFRKNFFKEDLLVDQMEEKGVEIIIGLIQDPTFGLSIMFGVGGIYTELYKDVTFRVVPIERIDAEEMVDEIKGKQLLEGFRNIPANKELVIDLLLKVSDLGEELTDRIDQMDLNPVFVYADDLCVVDAKLILK